MEKKTEQMSDFIYKGGVITMGKMYKIRQVFKCEGNFCYATTGYKVLYGTYLAAQSNITNLFNFRFVLM